jgi:hypothetical protein
MPIGLSATRNFERLFIKACVNFEKLSETKGIRTKSLIRSFAPTIVIWWLFWSSRPIVPRRSLRPRRDNGFGVIGIIVVNLVLAGRLFVLRKALAALLIRLVSMETLILSRLGLVGRLRDLNPVT